MDRKAGYKLPPTTIRDKLVSQEARRNKALEEQKRRRAQRVDSTRQLDLFADLTLGASDDEDTATIHEHNDEDEHPKVTPASVASYAAMLLPGYAFEPSAIASTSNAPSLDVNTINATRAGYYPPAEPAIDDQSAATDPSSKKRGKKKKGAIKPRRRTNKASKWADKCMYAELLEMNGDVPWHSDINNDEEDADGLPTDLETAWVAVAPVPVGKRCLAVTHQSAGVAGVVPNTTLRSRLLGKTLLARFPSALPPLTVLDCILDRRWRENGILHVLDVVRWKGQDVADCEARFRFWWRDTRLAELGQTGPPSSFSFTSSASPSSHTNPMNTQTSTSTHKYTFQYPTSFVPVPYHTNTSLAALDQFIVHSARGVREVEVSLPLPVSPSIPFSFSPSSVGGAPVAGGMDFESAPTSPTNGNANPNLNPATARVRVEVEPDGMLLYVAEASYEPGTSPLSSWVPIRGYSDAEGVSEGNGQDEMARKEKEGPLDLFHRLVKKRIARQGGFAQSGAEMQMDDGRGPPHADVEMEL